MLRRKNESGKLINMISDILKIQWKWVKKN